MIVAGTARWLSTCLGKQLNLLPLTCAVAFGCGAVCSMKGAIALLVRLVAAAEEAVGASYRTRFVVTELLGRADPAVASFAVKAIP